MKKIFLLALCSLWLCANSLCGYYLTHKDDNGKQSIVEIFKKDNFYYVYGFATTTGEESYDTHNPDPALKGRSMNGVVFVWGLKQDGNEWSGGKIYNYATGKTYDAKAWFEGDDILKIKASVWGFGKTLVWKKLTDAEVEKYLATKPSMDKVLSTIPQK